jgi:hypothetical protein
MSGISTIPQWSRLLLLVVLASFALLYVVAQNDSESTQREDETCVVNDMGESVCTTTSTTADNDDTSPKTTATTVESSSASTTGTNKASTKTATPVISSFSGIDIGVEQTLDPKFAPNILQYFLEQSRHYMQTVVYKDDSYAAVREHCRNQHELCSLWALIGEVCIEVKYTCHLFH